TGQRTCIQCFLKLGLALLIGDASEHRIEIDRAILERLHIFGFAEVRQRTCYCTRKIDAASQGRDLRRYQRRSRNLCAEFDAGADRISDVRRSDDRKHQTGTAATPPAINRTPNIARLLAHPLPCGNVEETAPTERRIE